MSVSILTISQWKRRLNLSLLVKMINQQTYQLIVEWVLVNGTCNPTEHQNFKPYIQEHISPNLNSNIKLNYVDNPDSQFKTIGYFRELSNQVATGDFLVCMDDDDYYRTSYVQHAVESIQQNRVELAGCTHNYLYDLETDTIYQFIGFGNYHTVNCTLAYTRQYAQNHHYQSHRFHAEEQDFLNQYVEPMVQMNPNLTMIQISTGDNTYNKREIIFQNLVAHMQSSIHSCQIINQSLEQLMNNSELYQDFQKLFDSIYSVKLSKYSIVYYCGIISPEWNPEDECLGGSEQAIINLSDQWSQIGYNVGIYGQFPFEQKTINGVDYINVNQFSIRDRYQNLILWRLFGMTPFFQYGFKFNCQKLIIDLHDNCPELYQTINLGLDQISSICFKSNFHSLMPKLLTSLTIPTAKSVVIENGIRINQFNSNLETVSKNKYRFCYINCYTRGLLPLLEQTWPIIYQKEPRAELHVYYGMKLVRDNQFKNRIKALLSQPGVMDHDRQPVQIVAREKWQSAWHIYCTRTLAEIDCISIRESLLTGAIPIISNNNLFSIRDGIHYDGDLTQTDGYIQLGHFILNLLAQPDDQIEQIRQKLKHSPTIISWTEIANRWLSLFEHQPKSTLLIQPKLKIIRQYSVINLDSRPDRWAEFLVKCQLDSSQFQRVAGIDGKNHLPLQDTFFQKCLKYNFDLGKREYDDGIFGCALSHFKILSQIAKNDALIDSDLVLVVEDDVLYRDNFQLRYQNFIKQLALLQITAHTNKGIFIYPGGRVFDNFISDDQFINWWKKINLHSEFDQTGQFYLRQTTNQFDQNHPYQYESCTFVLCYNKKAAKVLVQHFEQNYDLLEININNKFVILNQNPKIQEQVYFYDYFPHLFYSILSNKTDVQTEKSSLVELINQLPIPDKVNSLVVSDIISQFTTPTSIIIDIYSGKGDHLIQLAKILKEIHTFEPSLTNREFLLNNLRMNNLTNVTTHQFELDHFTCDQVDLIHLNCNDNYSNDNYSNDDLSRILTKLDRIINQNHPILLVNNLESDKLISKLGYHCQSIANYTVGHYYHSKTTNELVPMLVLPQMDQNMAILFQQYNLANCNFERKHNEYQLICCPTYDQLVDIDQYPDKKFILGPFQQILPSNCFYQLKNQYRNAKCLVTCDWIRPFWLHPTIPIETFCLGVDTDYYQPGSTRDQIIVYFNHPLYSIKSVIENGLREHNLNQYVFISSNQIKIDNAELLQSTKFMIIVSTENTFSSFIMQALSCDLPLLVWNIQTLQSIGQFKCLGIGTCVPYWDSTCGEQFTDQKQFGPTLTQFLSRLDQFQPRKYALQHLKLNIWQQKLVQILTNW